MKNIKNGNNTRNSSIHIKNKFNTRGKRFIFNFIKNAKFVSPDCHDITEQVRNKIMNINPSMVIGSGVIDLVFFQFNYSYITGRGNYRTNYKYIFFNSSELSENDHDKDIIIREKFLNWVNIFNSENPYRAISNVDILEIIPFASASLVVN